MQSLVWVTDSSLFSFIGFAGRVGTMTPYGRADSAPVMSTRTSKAPLAVLKYSWLTQHAGARYVELLAQAAADKNHQTSIEI